jgi:phosphatidylglycerophosphate synthase
MPPSGVINWPNTVSALRVPLAIGFWITPSVPIRIGILLVAAASDWFDGWLARRYGGSVPGGEVLDPIADKLFVIAVIAVLFIEQRITPLELALVLTRDVLVVTGTLAAFAARLRPRLRARLSGKIVTGFQIATLIGATAWRAAVLPLAIVTAVAGIVATVDYARAVRRSLHPPPPAA